MRADRKCQYCDKFFPNEEGRVFSNHVRWCDKNTSNGDKGVAKTAESSKRRFLNEFGPLKDFEVTCFRCKKNFLVKEREKRHPERDCYFCSRSCANSRGPRSEAFKELIRKKLTGKRQGTREEITTREKRCNFCNKNFFDSSRAGLQKSCSRTCSVRNRFRDVDKTSLKYYRGLCNFNFNLADFPDEFDFSLIEKHGWYRAKNRGNNLGGVSRDHILSVKYGYENGLDPKILSHPANCQLLAHGDNVSKGKKCHMTYEQLLEKIVEWNSKYGE